MLQKPQAGDVALPGHGVVELRLQDVNQLFDALDPSPLSIKDLDRRIEDYIVESNRELAGTGIRSLTVRVDQPTGSVDEATVGNAIRTHFERRSKNLARELRALLRRGLISLAIGVVFLAIFFLTARIVGQMLGENGWSTLFREGLLIVGWVAMWRPLEIFLYDWWPIVGAKRRSDQLSTIPVQLVAGIAGDRERPNSSPVVGEVAALRRWENEGGSVLPPQPKPAAPREAAPPDLVSEVTKLEAEWTAAALTEPVSPNEGQANDDDTSASQIISAVLTFIIQASLVVGLVMFALRHDWENLFLTLIVVALILIPAFVLRQYRVYVPPEFQLIAASFVFLTLYLGSAQDYYYRFWWWDSVLHAGSGFLLGIIGWIVLFLLNQTDRLPKGIRPVFLCFFGVTFAVFMGVLWEIFEFIVDSIWPHINMMSNETGVADTMHDLIVDTLGAILVGLMGWGYFKTGRNSFVVDAVRGFIRRNPRLFPRRRRQIVEAPAHKPTAD